MPIRAALIRWFGQTKEITKNENSKDYFKTNHTQFEDYGIQVST